MFAHTGPVYFVEDGQRVREEASIAYLRRYVCGYVHWLSTRASSADEQDRGNAERDAAEALRFYEAL